MHGFILFVFAFSYISAQIEAANYYKGGRKQLESDIRENLFLPPYVAYKCIQGPVSASFVILPPGKIDSISITESLNKDCDSAFIYALTKTKRWIKTDTPIHTSYTFVIEHHHNQCKNSDYYTAEAIKAYENKEYIKARELVDIALKINPLNKESLYLSGVLFILVGRTAEGCADLDLAIQLGHKDARNYKSTYCR